ncbi:hypothetical protein GMI70_02870 [Eggerthellaceae bacterium zg-893]|nr:hypothetical protein [Eggerthellaceae bacterium zg-893]
MAAFDNTIKAEDIAHAQDVLFIERFNKELNQLTEILGIFAPTVVAAGTAMYKYVATGELAEGSKTREEGDLVPLSHYVVEKEPIGEFELTAYRKMTTAEAITKNGYENAVIRTDDRMLKQLRAACLNKFFAHLDDPDALEAEGVTLQAALAQSKAVLQDAMETRSDEPGRVVHFVNMFDIADHLARAQISMQDAYGMKYVENFLGIDPVFVTNRVAKGTTFATPADNIQLYGVDFGALAQGGLVYRVSDSGLIGVSHEPAYDRVSTATNVLTGMALLTEISNYVVKTTISGAGQQTGEVA